MTAEEAISTPIGFTELLLKKPLYDWQREILMKFTKPRADVALAASNNAGKTAYVVCPLAIWFAAMHPNSLVIITASVDRQIREVVFHELNKYASLFPSSNPNAAEWTLPNGSRIIGFCTNHPGKFESWHNENFLLIADEAKSIPDPIFQAFDRCRPTHRLYASSPGIKGGEFYKSFTNPAYGFSIHKASAYDCPHVTEEEITKIITKYGIDHPFTRSTIFAEFMGDESDVYVITLSDVRSILDEPPMAAWGKKAAFIDFGAGGDETVIAIMDGNEVLPLICWRDKNTMSTVGRCITELRRFEVTAPNTFADEGGIGKPMCDAMMEAGFSVNRVNNQSAPYDSRYINRGGEMWWDAQYLIKNKRIKLPKDEILVEQLSNRFQAFDSKARLGVEKKELMKERGLNSPDRADAVCGVLSNYKWGYSGSASYKQYDPIQAAWDKMMDNNDRGQYAGFNPGDY